MSNMTPDARRALQRPNNYAKLSARTQWEIDKGLGILDWNPTKAEAEEFLVLWKEQGGEV